MYNSVSCLPHLATRTTLEPLPPPADIHSHQSLLVEYCFLPTRRLSFDRYVNSYKSVYYRMLGISHFDIRSGPRWSAVYLQLPHVKNVSFVRRLTKCQYPTRVRKLAARSIHNPCILIMPNTYYVSSSPLDELHVTYALIPTPDCGFWFSSPPLSSLVSYRGSLERPGQYSASRYQFE